MQIQTNNRCHQCLDLSMETKYYDWIDTAKGIGILLVIMEHTMFPVHAAVSIFHMPLFFFISGLTLKNPSDFGKFVIGKVNRIFVPYLFFTIICFFVCTKLFGQNNFDYNGSLWFLQTLFVVLLLCGLIVKCINRSNLIAWGLVMCAVLAYSYYSVVLDGTMFKYDVDFDRAIRSSFFVLSGFLLKNLFFTDNIGKHDLIKWILLLVFFIIFALLCYISVFRMGANGNFLNGDICKYCFPMFYVTSLSGIFLIIYFSKVCSRIALFKWLGQNSLVIMCVHYPFVQWWNQFLSSLSYFSDGILAHKIILAFISYLVIVLFCVPFIFLCKKWIPKLSGYDSLIKIENP